MKRLSSLAAAFAFLAVAAVASAQPVLIGAPGDPGGGNCFPFGCATGTRYQQVYAASNFTAGSVLINGITFFHTQNNPGGGTYAGATYNMYLSTTSAPVGGLNTNMSSNVGPNNALFGTFTVGGSAAASTLVFNGTPFRYDPTAGNLLLDIFAAYSSSGSVFLDARNGTATAAEFSRMHDYGGGFAGYGLVTEFATTPTPEPASLALFGTGMVGIGILARRGRRS